MPQFIVRLIDNTKGGDEENRIVKENRIKITRLLGENQTMDIATDLKLPPRKYDMVSILFWDAGSDKEVIIDDIKAWAF